MVGKEHIGIGTQNMAKVAVVQKKKSLVFFISSLSDRRQIEQGAHYIRKSSI